MEPTTAIVLALAIPLVGAALIVVTGRSPNLREAVTMVTAVALFADVLTLVPGVAAGGRPGVAIIEMFPGLALALEVEPSGMLFALVASGLWIVNSVYSIGYMRGNNEHKQTRYYTYFALALASTMGIAFAGNMLTLFVFYELLTLSTYPLVTHHGTAEAMRAGRTYLGILLGTSVALLMFGMIWTWAAAGTLDFTPGGVLAGRVSAPLTAVLLVLYMFGIGKAALMPVHRWLPAAMVAPTPVSALLHAVAVVKAGVFTVVKVIIYIFGIEHLADVVSFDWLSYVAGFTIIAASVVALRQDNLKRRLAYSTVSQLSYVVMAAAILVPLSVAGAIMHIAAHAIGKITLFLAAGSIYTAAHKTEVSQLAGIGRRMPWTMAAFGVASLSIIGLPPTIGFVSKWYILRGAFEAQHLFAIAVIIASTLLNAAYFLPIVYDAFFKPVAAGGTLHGGTPHGGTPHGEAPWPMVVALVATAAGTVVLFFLPGLVLSLAQGAVGIVP